MSNFFSHLDFCSISKKFPGVRALSNVSFRARKGSIHALMGENGAGKSTLLKILSGLYQPTGGRLLADGRRLSFKSATDALEQGVAVIYQELNLVPELSVAENIYLGQWPTRKGGRVHSEKLNHLAWEQLERLGEDFDPSRTLKELCIGQRQMVEIAKALSRDAQIIAFDEPTSSLSQREVKNLFKVIRDLRDKGKIVLYVSHRMEEIFHLCDSITVLKDGMHVKTFDDISSLTKGSLVELMVGREIKDVYNYRRRATRPESGLRIKSLEGKGLSQPVSFDAGQGEVLGLFGLIGAGRSELSRLIFGAEKITGGQVYIRGRPVTIRNPRDAIRAGIALCPEDRKADALVPVLSVKDNINISARPWNLRRGTIDSQWEERNAGNQRKTLNIRTSSLEEAAGHLSGGNQQKIILGRWLSTSMNVIVLDEPTRGIDIGAKSEIYRLIFTLANRGITVIMISSDLPEVLGVSDRLIVMRSGAVSGELQRREFKEKTALSLAMLGSR